MLSKLGAVKARRIVRALQKHVVVVRIIRIELHPAISSSFLRGVVLLLLLRIWLHVHELHRAVLLSLFLSFVLLNLPIGLISLQLVVVDGEASALHP